VAGTDRIFKLGLHLLLLLVVKPTGDRKQAREEKFSLGEEIFVIGRKPPMSEYPDTPRFRLIRDLPRGTTHIHRPAPGIQTRPDESDCLRIATVTTSTTSSALFVEEEGVTMT